jgi:hypothetical protein
MRDPSGWQDLISDTTVMIPSHYARIITVLVSFKTFSGWGISLNTLLTYLFRCDYLLDGLLISALGFTDVLYMCCSNKQEDITMEHTSTIRNMIDNPKHLKTGFIHEIEGPATMKMPIWNAQQKA